MKGAESILFSDAIAAEGALVFAKACELGLEGIVFKALGRRLLERALQELAEGQKPRLPAAAG